MTQTSHTLPPYTAVGPALYSVIVPAVYDDETDETFEVFATADGNHVRISSGMVFGGRNRLQDAIDWINQVRQEALDLIAELD